MSIISQSRPAPAQISATSGLPEQTHMPNRARGECSSRLAKLGVS